MNFPKGGIDGQVSKIIDQAADTAKGKINEALGGQKKSKQPDSAGAGLGGIGNMVTGAITNVAAEKATENAAGKAMEFGKKFLG